MKKITLYYATNRGHQGDDRWRPTGYGKNFSSDRSSNLRFGKVELDVDEALNKEIQKFRTKKSNKRIGDGEGLSKLLIEKSEESASIRAFKDMTAGGNKNPVTAKLASTETFKQLKKFMDKKQDVLINIHGFNVEWWEAVGSAMALELMLNRQGNDKEIKVFLFSWPSNGDMMKGRAYSSDRQDAKDSGLAVARGFLKLRDYLMTLRRKTTDLALKECGQDLHLLCHSMGNYVLQNTLASVANEVNTPALPRLFKNIFMCAPDVGDNVFESNKAMDNAHELCGHLSVYFNKGDMAMYISDFTKGNSERLGHAGAARPKHMHNKIHQIDCSNIVGGTVEHSYYLWATVNDDIRMTIDGLNIDDEMRKRKIKNISESILE